MRTAHLALTLLSSTILATSQLIVDNSPENLAIYNAIMSSANDHKVSISDTLGTLRSINIFGGLTRDVGSVHDRLETLAQNATVLCPANAAMLALGRKPWEETQAAGPAQGQGQAQADAKLKRFVEGHVVGTSPWLEGQKSTTLAGDTVWWEDRLGVRTIMPAGVQVESVQKSVGNGEVWVLKGVLEHA